MSKSIELFVGMDVHKDSIDVATGEGRAGELRPYGAIGGDLATVRPLAREPAVQYRAAVGRTQ